MLRCAWRAHLRQTLPAANRRLAGPVRFCSGDAAVKVAQVGAQDQAREAVLWIPGHGLGLEFYQAALAALWSILLILCMGLALMPSVKRRWNAYLRRKVVHLGCPSPCFWEILVIFIVSPIALPLR